MVRRMNMTHNTPNMVANKIEPYYSIFFGIAAERRREPPYDPYRQPNDQYPPAYHVYQLPPPPGPGRFRSATHSGNMRIDTVRNTARIDPERFGGSVLLNGEGSHRLRSSRHHHHHHHDADPRHQSGGGVGNPHSHAPQELRTHHHSGSHHPSSRHPGSYHSNAPRGHHSDMAPSQASPPSYHSHAPPRAPPGRRHYVDPSQRL